jgi:predicted secreted acid phosphatase
MGRSLSIVLLLAVVSCAPKQAPVPRTVPAQPVASAPATADATPEPEAIRWVRRAAEFKRREATPLPGAASFLARVRALGGKIAIVTNRLESECADTQVVFDAFKLAYDAMLCRMDGTPSDKNPRFAAVAAGKSPAGATPLEVVAFVGDNILDFPGLSQTVKAQGAPAFADFGVRFFMVPNPMYGSWQ